jgi:hypothetical protein
MHAGRTYPTSINSHAWILNGASERHTMRLKNSRKNRTISVQKSRRVCGMMYQKNFRRVSNGRLLLTSSEGESKSIITAMKQLISISKSGYIILFLPSLPRLIFLNLSSPTNSNSRLLASCFRKSRYIGH